MLLHASALLHATSKEPPFPVPRVFLREVVVPFLQRHDLSIVKVDEEHSLYVELGGCTQTEVARFYRVVSDVISRFPSALGSRGVIIQCPKVAIPVAQTLEVKTPLPSVRNPWLMYQRETTDVDVEPRWYAHDAAALIANPQPFPILVQCSIVVSFHGPP